MIYRDARDADRQAADRRCRSRPCSCIWVGAMQIMLDKGKDLDWFAVRRRSSTLAIVAVVGFDAVRHRGS